MNDMAALIGCAPPLRRLFVTDPRLWFKVMAGPITGAQFRLVGPGAQPAEARAALHAVPTMPLPVVLFEFALLLACKLLSLVGLSRFTPLYF